MELKNCPRCDQELEFGKRHTGCGPKESRIQGKPRMAWSAEMQQRFVSAVNRLGIQEATPMKIVSLMNIEGLTRDHVRGRLDSYRSRLRMGATPIRMPHNWNAYPAAYPGQAGYPWHMEYHMAPDAGYRVPVPGASIRWSAAPHGRGAGQRYRSERLVSASTCRAASYQTICTAAGASSDQAACTTARATAKATAWTAHVCNHEGYRGRQCPN